MRVKNWDRFQHYRDGRTLHWIRLHKSLLDNYDFAALSGDDAKVLILCWLVAAEKDGELPDVPALAFRLRMDPRKLGTSIRALVDRGFLESVPFCTNPVQENTDTPEVLVPREETEKRRDRGEKRQSSAPADRDAAFERFWQAYPRKTAKTAARKAWAKLYPVNGLLDTIMAAVAAQSNSRQWLTDGGRFIPHPATWLNNARWEDEVAETKTCGDGSPVPFEER
jgi:hypothetical protein